LPEQNNNNRRNHREHGSDQGAFSFSGFHNLIAERQESSLSSVRAKKNLVMRQANTVWQMKTLFAKRIMQ
jgi:hypothetical protein